MDDIEAFENERDRQLQRQRAIDFAEERERTCDVTNATKVETTMIDTKNGASTDINPENDKQCQTIEDGAYMEDLMTMVYQALAAEQWMEDTNSERHKEEIIKYMIDEHDMGCLKCDHCWKDADWALKNGHMRVMEAEPCKNLAELKEARKQPVELDPTSLDKVIQDHDR